MIADIPLRQKLKVILDTFDSLCRQGGVVEKEMLIGALYGKVDAAVTEELVQHLINEGILHSPRPGVLEKTQ